MTEKVGVKGKDLPGRGAHQKKFIHGQVLVREIIQDGNGVGGPMMLHL